MWRDGRDHLHQSAAGFGQLYLPILSLYSSTLATSVIPSHPLSALYSCVISPLSTLLLLQSPLRLVSSCDAACFPHNFTLAVFCVHYEQVW